MKRLGAVLCGCAFLALPGIARAATITGNVEWTTTQPTQFVTSDLTIAAGATLTVDAGVQVVVSPGVKIDVLGALRTTSAGGSTLFRSSDPFNQWQGIVAEPGSSLSLVNAGVRDTRQTTEAGIACYGCRLTLERSVIGQNPGGSAAALRIYSTPGALVNGVNAYGGVHVYAGPVTIQGLTAPAPNGFLTLDDGLVSVMYSEIDGPVALGTAATGRFAFGNDTLGGDVSLSTGRASFTNTIVFGNVTAGQRRSAIPTQMTFGATMVTGVVRFSGDPTSPPSTLGVLPYDATKLLGTGAPNNIAWDNTGVAVFCQTSLPCNIGPDPAPRPLQPGSGTSTALALDPPGGATAGQTIALTATVAPLSGDVLVGNVEFVEGSFFLGTPCTVPSCTVLATAVVGADGVAHATVTLPAGSHHLAAVFRGGTDPISGDALFQSGSSPVDYVVRALSAPVLTAPADGVTAVGTNIPLTIAATPGATITLTVDGTTQTLTPDGAGIYSAALSLPYGTHTLSATQTIGGVTSAATAVVTVHLLPPAPTIATPADGATLHAPTVDLAGSGVPGAVLAIVVDGVATPSGVVDATGAFAFSLPLGWGPHQISVAQVVAGTQGPSADVAVAIVPEAPALTAPADGATVVGPFVDVAVDGVPGATALLAIGGAPAGAVTLDASGHYAGSVGLPYGADTVTVAQTIGGVTSPTSAPVLVHVAPAPPTVVSPTDGTIASGPVNVAGTGVANATVDLLVDGAPFSTTSAAGTGAFDLPLTLAPGTHVLSLTQSIAGERSTPTTGVHVSVRPDSPTIAAPADGSVAAVADVQVAGNADPGVEVDVYDGATKAGTASADATGAYAVTVHLADGSHTLTAVAAADGLTSLPSAAVHVVVDTTAPTSTATTSPPAATWFRGPVHVTIAADDGSGSGVAAIHAEANGVDTGAASFDVAAEGVTTVSYWAVDRAGNAEQPHTLTIRIDQTPPAVTCDAAPTGWLAAEAAIGCTATDGGSGLAGDASFRLAKSVGAGNETSNASTGTAQVCDLAGNCTTAGPIGGIEVDRKAPAISGVGGTYALGAGGSPTFSCADGGSGVASCTASPLDTATPGTHTFTVIAVDNVGNRSEAAVSYVVRYSSASLCLGEAAHTVLPPFDAAGTVTAKGNSTVPVKFRVCDAAGRSVGTPGVVASFTPGLLSFRWDPTDQQWVANLSTRGLAVGAHRYTIALNDGTTITFTVSVR